MCLSFWQLIEVWLSRFPSFNQSHTSFTPSSTATTSTSSSARSRWSTPLWERWDLALGPEDLATRWAGDHKQTPTLCCSSAGGLLPSGPSLQERQRRLTARAGALLDVLPQGPPQLLRAWRLLLLLWRPAVVDQRAADQPPASRAGSLHHAGKQVLKLEHSLNPTTKPLIQTQYAKLVSNSFTYSQWTGKKMVVTLSWGGFSDILIQKILQVSWKHIFCIFLLCDVQGHDCYTSSENGALRLAVAKEGIFLRVIKEKNKRDILHSKQTIVKEILHEL